MILICEEGLANDFSVSSDYVLSDYVYLDQETSTAQLHTNYHHLPYHELSKSKIPCHTKQKLMFRFAQRFVVLNDIKDCVPITEHSLKVFIFAKESVLDE